MPRYANDPNPQMIEVAEPVFELRRKIIAGIAGEVACQRDLYERQRKVLADKEEEPYYHSGIYFRMWDHVDVDTGEKTYNILWRFGNKRNNAPAAVAARKKNLKFTRAIKATGQNGMYTQADLRPLLRFYKPWELKLAYRYEKHRLRPLRNSLRDFNSFLQIIKRAPDIAQVERGYLQF